MSIPTTVSHFTEIGFFPMNAWLQLQIVEQFPFSSFPLHHPYVSYILDRLQLLAAPGACHTAEGNIAAAECFQGAWLLEIWVFEQVMGKNSSRPDLIPIKRLLNKCNTRKKMIGLYLVFFVINKKKKLILLGMNWKIWRLGVYSTNSNMHINVYF